MHMLGRLGPGLLAAFAGALVTLSLAPHDIWPAAIASLCLYMGLLHNCTSRRALLLGWLYGLGLFGTGASWVYVSIHEHGQSSRCIFHSKNCRF